MLGPRTSPGSSDPQRTVSDQGELRLYVTGTTLLSTRAIENIEALIREELAGTYICEIIDVLERPDLAEEDGIFATPTLVRRTPEPVRKLIGDLSDRELVLSSLRLTPAMAQVFDRGGKER
jgi:circadian clock protein KaiB